MSDKNIRSVLLKLDSVLFDRLDKECKSNKVTKADLLRGLIEYYLNQPSGQKPVITITKRLNLK